MGGQMGKLTAMKAAKAGPGEYADGLGLLLRVSPNLSRYWIYRFRFAGKRREMGLGNLVDISLAEARDTVLDARRLVKQGVDPIAARRADRAAVHRVTFGEAADGYFAVKKAEYRNEIYRGMVWRWLTELAEPIRSRPVEEIDTDAVLSVVAPVWSRAAKTGRALREKIEGVLDYAAVHRWRHGDNPARWKGHLEHLLAKHDPTLEGHHAAMPYKEAPAFYARLAKLDGVAARALEFTILTAARSGECRGATWAEIDPDDRTWTVPGKRMKEGYEHIVPLCDRALAILQDMNERREGEFIFPGNRRGKPLSSMALAYVLKRLGVNVTAHGFRSTFRDWVGDCTEHEREIAEAALSHRVGGKVERAYRRGSALNKRRAMMDDWSAYLRGGR
jgi:integrase